MEIRPRTETDLDGAVSLLARVHVADGYPSTLAEGTAFLVPPYEVAAWVAVDEEGIVGHVALHRPPAARRLPWLAELPGSYPTSI